MKKPSVVTCLDPITLQQAADILQCSVKTIRRRISDGQLTGFQLGVGVRPPLRVSEAEVRALLVQIPTG